MTQSNVAPAIVPESERRAYPPNGEMLEALDRALGGRWAVQQAISAEVLASPPGPRMGAVARLWERHCAR